jgi:hypothetical protein
MLTTSIERLEQIEQERLEIFADTSFQEWMKEFKVGRLAIKPKDGASDMMNLWTNKHGIKNSFNQVINNLK